ncbi:tyrosine-type recombinase/integrase [Pontibacterium granulatum]|uniref:phage integrase n=1 Tax=Pontibacterium granulatum TaxID=2036029 RepID=UPI00249C5C6B|nr:tyrosine-type recombinase/integrase [Pontibacterium granulatum]MDI3324739.1 tyrosine-type recombinase/integrase [Pontibacterium granulatum]
MPRKTTDGRWLVDIRPYGANGPRIRRKFDRKAEATRFEAYEINKAKDSPWEPQSKDTRKLSELIELWRTHHGKHIASGRQRVYVMKEFAAFTRDKQGRLVQGTDFLNFRALLLDQEKAISTVNAYLRITKGLFNRLAKLDLIRYENPLRNVEPLKDHDNERDFLDKTEIEILLAKLKADNYDLYMNAKICLSVGARWSEARNLKPNDINHSRIRFINTKSRKSRSIPITQELEAEIMKWLPNRQLTDWSRVTFSELLEEYGFKKAFYQSTHILRHTFASHFIMNGGGLVTLQKTLGHSNIKTTMIYAHLSPEHLSDVVELNPVNMDT